MTQLSILRSRWFWRTVLAVLVGVPIALTGPYLTGALFTHGKELYDFRGGLYNAGVAILHGHSPYWPHFLAHQLAIMKAGGVALGETSKHPFSIPVYPAFANLLVVPLALLPFWVAGVLYTLASMWAMFAGVRLLGVRDWRCFAVIALSWPFEFGLYLGAIGPWLVLGCGIAWRYRDRVRPVAVGIAAVVAAKIFPWTLGVWLVITRRWRAAFLCLACGVVLTFGAWAAIGFHGLTQYPTMLSEMSQLQEGRADSIVTVLRVAGVSAGTASSVAMLCAIALLAVACRLSGGVDGDRRAFGLAVLAALASTPIVWDHYMVLCFVPLALTAPQFSRLWLTPLVIPTLWILSYGVADDSRHVQAASPNALRSALAYLLLQAIVGVALCTTASQRAAWVARLRRRPVVAVGAAAVDAS